MVDDDHLRMELQDSTERGLDGKIVADWNVPCHKLSRRVQLSLTAAW